jgi:hypothetical protein
MGRAWRVNEKSLSREKLDSSSWKRWKLSLVNKAVFMNTKCWIPTTKEQWRLRVYVLMAHNYQTLVHQICIIMIPHIIHLSLTCGICSGRWKPSGIQHCVTEADQCFRGAYCLSHNGDEWWWRQYAPLKHKSTSTRLHGVISLTTAILTLAAVRTWDLI